VKPDHNALGKAAFVIGLIGLALSFIPIIGFVSWLLAPLAIVFGLIALRRPSRSLAIAGIITGAIALVVCFGWAKGTQSFSEAMSADTFNNTGKTADTAVAPIIDASIKGLWQELDENKIAAGKKYGGHRVMFSKEVIADFGGTATNPNLEIVGYTDGYLQHSVTASFSSEDGEKIGMLKKGQKISFLCNKISESVMGGYGLEGCSLK
jgi:hypothetical protein